MRTPPSTPPSAAPILPPSPKGLPLLGNALAYGREPLAFAQRCVRELGDVVYIRVPGYPTYLIARPDDIEHVLVKAHQKFIKDKFTRGLGDALGNGLLVSEGEFWKRQRRLAQPAFHHQEVRGYADAMVSRAAAAFDGWRSGEVRDVHHDMMRLTVAIVGKTLFDAEVQDEADEVAACLDAVMDTFLGIFQTGLRPPLWLPTPG